MNPLTTKKINNRTQTKDIRKCPTFLTTFKCFVAENKQ